MFDQDQFLADLKTFIGFRTCVETNPDDFARARAWIKAFFDPERTAFIELEYEGFVNLIIKPADSLRPNVLGDGHIEVVPGDDELFVFREERGLLYGRGVADMKTQCLMMMVVLRQLIDEGDHNDFWILFSEDEEIGSPNGAKQVISYLCGQSMQPQIVFVPDGGHDFAFVEKEKGKLRFTVTMPGVAAHASRPFLGENAIEKMMAFYRHLQGWFPNPKDEADWVNSVVVARINAGQAYNQIPDRCQAGFDLRLTEAYRVEELMEQIENEAEPLGAEVKFHEADMATYYPREGPVARKFIEILRRVSGREPPILHANGASNGRFYLANDPDIHVLMSNPTVVGLHSDDECLVATSLEPYYRLVLETALLRH